MKVLSVFGTRPEAIKMAPVVKALIMQPNIQSVVCVTGQHRTMLDQVLAFFDIVPDYDLAVMGTNQTLNELLAKIISKIDAVLAEVQPDYVLVHGDTTTAMAASVACFHKQIAIGHVEAGLRTYDLVRPWPEEFNRRIIDVAATKLFAPTQRSADNLRTERLGGEIIITGNTVIDALKQTVERIGSDPLLEENLNAKFAFLNPTKRVLLVTGHRRESFGDGMLGICRALLELSRRNDLEIVYPVHLNPNVQGPVRDLLSKNSNIHLIEPQEYLAFVYLMNRVDIILTDSGGVQEEAPSLGKPVLVMRNVTERPEAIAAGVVRTVGTDTTTIVNGVTRLLDNPEYYASFARAMNPYGDGYASQRIVASLMNNVFEPFVEHKSGITAI